MTLESWAGAHEDLWASLCAVLGPSLDCLLGSDPSSLTHCGAADVAWPLGHHSGPYPWRSCPSCLPGVLKSPCAQNSLHLNCRPGAAPHSPVWSLPEELPQPCPSFASAVLGLLCHAGVGAESLCRDNKLVASSRLCLIIDNRSSAPMTLVHQAHLCVCTAPPRTLTSELFVMSYFHCLLALRSKSQNFTCYFFLLVW